MKVCRQNDVSILLPVYNGGKFLRRALLSLMSQSWRHLEIIVIDDGSTDKSLAIARSCENDVVRVLRLEENMGYGSAVQKGFEASRGLMIARGDADDASSLRRIEKQVRFLDVHPEIAFVGTRRWLISPSGRRLGVSEWPQDAGDWLEETWESVFSGRRYFTDSSVMVRRAALEAVGGWRNYQRSGMDVDLWLRLLEKGFRGATLKAPLYYRRLHPGGLIFTENTSVKNAVVRRMAEERRRCGTDAVMRGEPIDAGFPAKKADGWAVRRRQGSFQWSIGGDCAAKCDFDGARQFAVAALVRCGVVGIGTKGFLRFLRGLFIGGRRLRRLWWWRTRKKYNLLGH